MRRWLNSSVTVQFFVEFPRAHRGLALAWWALILVRGALPAGFAVAVGALVGAVSGGHRAVAPLAWVGGLFILSQVLAPLHGQVGTLLGEQLSAWLDDELLRATVPPTGLAHLESADLIDDLTLARDFDLALSGPPLSLAMAFIAGGLTEFTVGSVNVLVLLGYRWWAALAVGAAWLATHWLLKSATAWDKLAGDSLEAQRQAEYAYRLAMDPPAAKEVRLFGLSEWLVARFAGARRRLVEVRWLSTRISPARVAVTVLLLVAVNAAFFWLLARDAVTGALALPHVVTFAQVAVGASALGFGGFNWALPHAAHGVATVRGLRDRMRAVGDLPAGNRSAAAAPALDLRLRDVTFSYDPGLPAVLEGFDLRIPAGTSMAIVGANGAGKTTLVKLLCRLYDPTGGAIEVDGVDLREYELGSWRDRLAAVFQDFIRYDLSLRDNVSPRGAASDDEVRSALAAAGADRTTALDTVLAPGYDHGVNLSGGQWQRVALARALLAVQRGAGVVILDEPTAQLDVRGEAEVFQRLLERTRGLTTILISHRFSTVRHADRICVVEHGRVVEQGSHDELIALGGRYRDMFEVQAARFDEEASDGHVLA